MNGLLKRPAFPANHALSKTFVGRYTDSSRKVWNVRLDSGAIPHNALIYPADGEDVSSPTIDLLGPINYLKGQSIVTGTDYFNSFALGVEQKQGSGSMKLNSFSVTYH